MEKNKQAHEMVKEIITSYSGQAAILATPVVYIEYMGDDHDAGLLLSQIIYWSDKSDRQECFYKTYADWHQETRLNEYKIRKSVKKMKEAGFLTTKVKRAGGDPVVHYYFDMSTFLESFLKFLQERNPKNEMNETIKSEETISEITPEITPETLSSIVDGDDSSDPPEYSQKIFIYFCTWCGNPLEVISINGKEPEAPECQCPYCLKKTPIWLLGRDDRKYREAIMLHTHIYRKHTEYESDKLKRYYRKTSQGEKLLLSNIRELERLLRLDQVSYDIAVKVISFIFQDKTERDFWIYGGNWISPAKLREKNNSGERTYFEVFIDRYEAKVGNVREYFERQDKWEK